MGKEKAEERENLTAMGEVKVKGTRNGDINLKGKGKDQICS